MSNPPPFTSSLLEKGSTQQDMVEVPALSPWQQEVLFFDGDEYFASISQQLETAQTEVLVESYIYDLDGIGIRLLELLAQARQRGVRVRLLVDGIGSYNWIASLSERCKKLEIEFRVYHPLPFSIQKLKSISWKNLRRWIFLFQKVNNRNHRKTVVIDGQKAFLGSFNISQVHSRRYMGTQVWRDSGVFIQGPQTESLRKAFLHSWQSSTMRSALRRIRPLSFLRRKRFKNDPSSLLRLNTKMRWRFNLLRDLNKRFRTAQSRILITNAYFVPRKSVLRNLRRAARRGVFVGLCLPEKTDVWLVKAASRSLYYRLLKDGVHLYEYQPSVLHAKTLIIDDWATVGSHNLNHRSLNHDLEVEAIITNSDNLRKLLDQWDQDVRQSKRADLKDYDGVSVFTRMVWRFIYWFRYWL